MANKKKRKPAPIATEPKKSHIDRRTLWVRIVAICMALLIAGSALSVLLFY